MTARRKNNVSPVGEEIPSLAEILQDSTASVRDTFSDIDANTFLRLVGVVTGSGFMVTCWDDTVNGRFCLSVRGGADKRSYNFDTAEQFQVVAEQLIGVFAPIARKRGEKPPIPATIPTGTKDPNPPPVKP